MKRHKILIACSVFEKELQACLPPEGRPESIWRDVGLHADLSRLEEQLTRALEEDQGDGAEENVFFGSGCHSEICRLARRFATGIAPVKSSAIGCVCEELAGKDLVFSAVREHPLRYTFEPSPTEV